MNFNFTPVGVCPTNISFDLIDGAIHHVEFTKGCNGNLKAIAKLIEGKPAEEIVALFKGHLCKERGTSCADQLARAVEYALEQQKKAS